MRTNKQKGFLPFFMFPLLNQHKTLSPFRLRKSSSGSFMFMKIFFINFLWLVGLRRIFFWLTIACVLGNEKALNNEIFNILWLRSLSNILLNLLSAYAPIKVLFIFGSAKEIKSLVLFFYIFPGWWEPALQPSTQFNLFRAFLSYSSLSFIIASLVFCRLCMRDSFVVPRLTFI